MGGPPRTQPRRRGRTAAAVGLALLSGGSWADVPPPHPPVLELVVVANRREPESERLARLYLERRTIPEARLLLVDVPSGRSLSRADYDTGLVEPLRRFLLNQDLVRAERDDEGRVRYTELRIQAIALLHGVPWKIRDTKTPVGMRLADRFRRPDLKDAAAVDSELTLALHPPYPLGGPRPNPRHGALTWGAGTGSAAPLLMVCRLDGPSPDVVERMIHDAVAADKAGLQGRAVIDLQGLRPRGDGYYQGDYWMAEAGERLAREGYSVWWDRQRDPLPAAAPIDHVAFYAGWYSQEPVGPFTRPDFRFAPGAFAMHLFSGAARDLRDAEGSWAGLLLDRGAAFTFGPVSEPYLTSFPDLRHFTDRWVSGLTFAESAYLAMPHLSWQITVIGDPLARPFARPAARQMEAAEVQDRAEAAAWAKVRIGNQWLREGRFEAALTLWRNHPADDPARWVVEERLAEALVANGRVDAAFGLLGRIAADPPSPEAGIRALALQVWLLRQADREDEAERLVDQARDRWPDHPGLGWIGTARELE